MIQLQLYKYTLVDHWDFTSNLKSCICTFQSIVLFLKSFAPVLNTQGYIYVYKKKSLLDNRSTFVQVISWLSCWMRNKWYSSLWSVLTDIKYLQRTHPPCCNINRSQYSTIVYHEIYVTTEITGEKDLNVNCGLSWFRKCPDPSPCP